MVFTRMCRLLALFTLLPAVKLSAQTILYPTQASTVLKNTAADMAMLLKQAITGSNFTTQSYTVLPATGIVLEYDTSITDNQKCTVNGNGTNFLKFTAAEDNGLIFGVYQYLYEAGFRFYQPGSIWQTVPSLTTAFKNIRKDYNSSFKYKTWFISGGHRLWIMDKTTAYNWEGAYIGENGHEWSLYMRRNRMMGQYNFTGHRGDIVTGNYLSTLQNNPCYVASYNGSRQAGSASVPDINNESAKTLWASAIETKFTAYKNTVMNNTVVYNDLYRTYRYNNTLLGIEVPDGPRWGNNTANNSGCAIQAYPSAADQSAVLANNTVNSIRVKYPQQRFQLYAYSTHADIPSSAVSLSQSIDVQVPTVYQNESSIKGLLKRWYQKHSAVSEYHYLNLASWSGETPAYRINELRQAATRLKQEHSQGIVIESSPAKFVSLPTLLALNNNLLSDKDMDQEIKDFCNSMFGAASSKVYELLMQLGDEQVILSGSYGRDNRFRFPFIMEQLNKIVAASAGESGVVKKRIAELKAYIHYFILYHDYVFNEKYTAVQKKEKAGEVCMYLARCNKLLIVNSYTMINNIVNSNVADTAFVKKYNSQTGTAYQSGNISLISAEEIENNYNADISQYRGKITGYSFTKPAAIISSAAFNTIQPVKKINVKINYTQGAAYYNRIEYRLYAPSATSFSIKYNATTEMPEEGQLNFTVENAEEALTIIKDVTIKSDRASGTINVEIPKQGYYMLSVVSKFKTVANLEITTNGIPFYKNSPYLGNVTESYAANPGSLPGYFFVPADISRVYFSVNNSYNTANGYMTTDELNAVFTFKDNKGKAIKPVASGTDGLLFYLDVPAGQSGSFWQFTNTANRYALSFANISNYSWYANRKSCSGAGFSISVQKEGDECVTILKADNYTGSNKWEVYDKGRVTWYENKKELMLPSIISPSAVITHYINESCSETKILDDLDGYKESKENCASAAPLPTPTLAFSLSPNPSKGRYYLFQDGMAAKAQVIEIFDMNGKKLYHFNNTGEISVTQLPAALYLYKIQKDGASFSGKIAKL